jgi:hypothetical protein
MTGIIDGMVPKAGLEPARALARHPLKMVCLPSSTTSAWKQYIDDFIDRQEQKLRKAYNYTIKTKKLLFILCDVKSLIF